MFSVVIITKNRQDFLIRAIESVLSNECKPDDIVIINDGGVPPSLDRVKSEITRINLVNNKISMGANFSRNQGVRLAENEIVFLLDDDDSYTACGIKNRLDLMTSDHEIGICYTGARIVKSDNLDNVIRFVKPRKSKNAWRELVCNGNFIGSTSRVAIRKSIFLKVGGFDEKLNCFQDFDLWLRMSRIAKVSTDGNLGINYTIHVTGEQISSRHERYRETTIILSEKHRKELKACNLYRDFMSSNYLRVAIAASKTSFLHKIIYSFKSLWFRPNRKALILLITPTYILDKLYPYT